MTYKFDSIDHALLVEKIVARDALQGPRLGDFVRYATGEFERISNIRHAYFLQTSSDWAGSFFLSSCGHSCFSGGLNGPIPWESLLLTPEEVEGAFWCFHHDEVGAGRRVECAVPCRVFSTAARYRCLVADL